MRGPYENNIIVIVKSIAIFNSFKEEDLLIKLLKEYDYY
ncbi:MAG: hypothetical protein ACJAZK_000474 [Psychroserpens sp.]|jgi:hypothetical protein